MEVGVDVCGCEKVAKGEVAPAASKAAGASRLNLGAAMPNPARAANNASCLRQVITLARALPAWQVRYQPLVVSIRDHIEHM